MKKLFYQLLLFTFVVIGWVVYSNWPKIEAFADRVIAVGEDLAKMAKSTGILPADVIEAGEDQPNAATPESAQSLGSQSTSTLYKWQDNSGRWHFGDQPPQGATKVQQMKYAPNANVMKPTELPEPEIPSNTAGARGGIPQGSGMPQGTTIPGIPNPQQVSELMNKVDAIKSQMNARNRALGEKVDEDDSEGGSTSKALRGILSN